MTSEYRKLILEALANSDVPLHVEKIRTIAGIRNFQTAKALIFELVAQGKVVAVKTSKSWIFMAPQGEAKSTKDQYQQKPANETECCALSRRISYHK
jgi:hypothetical protein